MGYERDRFDSQPRNELLCPVCKLVFEDPVQGLCGHVYCSTCRVPSDPWNYEDCCPVDYKLKDDSHAGAGRGYEDGNGRRLSIGHGRAVITRSQSNVALAGIGRGEVVLPGVNSDEQISAVSEKDDPKSCPSGTTSLALPLKAILDKLKIKCKYSENCSWSGPIGELSGHELVCCVQVIHAQIEQKKQEIRELKKKLLDLQLSCQN